MPASLQSVGAVCSHKSPDNEGVPPEVVTCMLPQVPEAGCAGPGGYHAPAAQQCAQPPRAFLHNVVPLTALQRKTTVHIL